MSYKLQNIFFNGFILVMLVLASFTLVKCQKIIEELPDKSYIIEIDGKEYRALPVEKVREIQARLKEGEATKKAYEEYQKAFAKYQKKSDELLQSTNHEWNLRLQKSEGQVKFWKEQFEEEKRYSEDLRKRMPLCSPKLIFFKICL